MKLWSLNKNSILKTCISLTWTNCTQCLILNLTIPLCSSFVRIQVFNYLRQHAIVTAWSINPISLPPQLIYKPWNLPQLWSGLISSHLPMEIHPPSPESVSGNRLGLLQSTIRNGLPLPSLQPIFPLLKVHPAPSFLNHSVGPLSTSAGLHDSRHCDAQSSSVCFSIRYSTSNELTAIFKSSDHCLSKGLPICKYLAAFSISG